MTQSDGGKEIHKFVKARLWFFAIEFSKPLLPFSCSVGAAILAVLISCSFEGLFGGLEGLQGSSQLEGLCGLRALACS